MPPQQGPALNFKVVLLGEGKNYGETMLMILCDFDKDVLERVPLCSAMLRTSSTRVT